MAHVNSFGFGTGISVTAAGLNVVLPRACGKFRIRNEVGGNLYVVLNTILVSSLGPPPVPVVGVHPIGSVPLGDLQITRKLVASALAIATKIPAGSSELFEGFAAFNGGPQIVCLGLIGDATITVSGGMVDIAN